MNQLTKKNTILVGLTLFSMFFGAGNLIFPPFLGNQAGVNVWIAMAGFAVTAIGFPIFGVAAVAKSGGLDVLAKRVHPVFASIFTLLIYVSIGPGLAIPRTASTSFEMAVLPFIPTGIDAGKVFSGVLFRGIFDCFETGKIDRMFGEIFDSMSACADFYRICAGAVF